MIRVVQPSPVQPLHFAARIVEHGGRPVDDRREQVKQSLGVVVVAMLGHVILDVSTGRPVERGLQYALTFRIALRIHAPLVHTRVVRVGEDLTGRGDERTRVHTVEQFLFVERHSGDVDRFEP